MGGDVAVVTGREACAVCGKAVKTRGHTDIRRGPEGLIRCADHVGEPVELSGPTLRIRYKRVVGDAPDERRLVDTDWCCAEASFQLRTRSHWVEQDADCCDDPDLLDDIKFCPFCGARVVFEKVGLLKKVKLVETVQEEKTHIELVDCDDEGADPA